MANAPFKTDPVRTAIALSYSNSEYIGDRVLPRIGVGAREYKYTVYNKKDRFTVPNTSVGRKGRVNEIEFGATELSGMVSDYGLEDPIPQADIDAARNTDIDPISDATENLSDLIMLDREVRVARLVHTKANYTSKDTISGNDQWNDSAGTSDPIEQITEGLETPIIRPNTMVINGLASLALRRNPAILKAYNGAVGSSGIVPMSFIKELFELDEILVGRAKNNTANVGQDMTLSEVWGNHCALIYLNPQARPNRGITFGWTAQYKGRVAGTFEDRNIGLEGGTRVRVGEMVEERIVAKDAAYFLENVVASS